VAVELFLVGDQVLVNELAPRPHNSGHLSIDASETDQFEQHLRAVCGAPLGSTRLVTPAVMQNLLGHPQAHGVPLVTGLDALLGCPGAHLHWYGKEEVRPFRKMGHITVTAEELGEALRRATDLADYTQVASLSK
jgi:5-(carboxyamino)imidazole ribonucleotide synthase